MKMSSAIYIYWGMTLTDLRNTYVLILQTIVVYCDLEMIQNPLVNTFIPLCSSQRILAHKDFRYEFISCVISYQKNENSSFVERQKGLTTSHVHMQSNLCCKLKSFI